MKLHVLLIAATLFLGATVGAIAQGTAFTYQGRLDDGPSPANGSYDLRFSLHSALIGGSQVGSVVTTNATGVTNGLFTVTLDFGNQFPSAGRWLEIGVRTNGGGAFETLAPRQAITATPYAITAGNITGSINGSLITAGSIPDSGLSTNVALRSGGNIFSGTQTISGLVTVNSNVGIGVISPGKRLQVGGATGTEGMIRLQSASATTSAARTWDIGVPKDDTDASGKYYSFVIDDLGFGTEPEFMVKFGNGRVGIGTTNPAAKLDVNGDVWGTGKLNINSSGYNDVTSVIRARSGEDTALVLQDLSGNNLLQIFTNGQASLQGSLYAGGKLNINSSGYTDVTSVIRARSGEDTPFVVQDLPGNNLMQVFTNGVVTVSGKLGIGTVSPSAKLHVNGDIWGTGKLNINSSGFSDVTSVIRARTGEDTPFVVQGVPGNNLLQVFTNGAVSVGGQLGIGTLSPGFPLNFPSTLGDKISLYGASGNHFGFGISPSTLQIHSDQSSSDVAFGYGSSANMTETVRIKGNGYVGIGMGTNALGAMLHIRQKTTNHHALLIESATGAPQVAVYQNGQVNVSGPFYALGNAEVWGEVTTTAINLTSDRNAKEGFKPVNPREVLDKVARLPISEWQYKSTDKRASDGSRHIGPMAQDFREAFALGRDDKHITSVDADGVALAAIQGLNEKLEAKTLEVEALKQSVAELRELVGRLTQSVNR